MSTGGYDEDIVEGSLMRSKQTQDKDSEKQLTTKRHPGEINETEGYSKLVYSDSYLRHLEDSDMIKTSVKEDEDFVILPDSAFKYLFEIYGGKDCQRVSIQL